MHDEELICRKSEHLSTTNDLPIHFGQCISTKDDPFVRNIYIYARIILYAIEVSTAVRERALQASIELLKVFKHRPPTAACLIERVAGDLINFQAVVKKRGFTSFDELIISIVDNFQFFNSSQEQAYRLPAVSSELWYYITVLIICALGFSTNGYPCPYVARLFCYLLGKRFSQDTSRVQAIERS